MRIVIPLFVFALQFNLLNAQETNDSFLIHSKIMKSEEHIEVSLPNDQRNINKPLPVLFVLDGSTYYPLSVATKRMLHQFNSRYTPDFIVVSISTPLDMRKRYSIYLDENLSYADFLEKELIPEIEKRYNVGERYIFGWQYAGSFAVRMLLEKPNLFNAYFVADPYPLMGKFDTVFNTFYEKLSKIKTLKKSLYLVYGKNGGTVKEGSDFLRSQLERSRPKDLRFQIKQLDDEEHRSTPFNALYSGLKDYHYNFSELVISSRKEFDERGGLNYLVKYYENRSKRYGFQNTIGKWTMFTLVRNAIRENNFTDFAYFMTLFKPYKLISQLRLSRAISIGTFYQKHSKYDEAKEVFSEIYKEHSESIRLNKALAELSLAMKDKEQEQFYLKKIDVLSKISKE